MNDIRSFQGSLLVEPYVLPNPGPYPVDQPKKNTIPFTPKQGEKTQSLFYFDFPLFQMTHSDRKDVGTEL
jgi:hypothetical protein